MRLIMQVTTDKYELPLAIARSISDMSRISGVRYDTIYNSLRNNCRGYKYKFVYVEVPDDMG